MTTTIRRQPAAQTAIDAPPFTDYKAAARWHRDHNENWAEAELALLQSDYTADELRAFWRAYNDSWRASRYTSSASAALMVACEVAARALTTVTAPAATASIGMTAETRKRIKTVPEGHYGVTFTEGGPVELFKVDIGKRGKWVGFRFVVRVVGDHHSRVDRNVQTAALLAIAADPRAASVAYGQHTGTCGVCARRLTDPASIARGIGPTCDSKF